MSTTSRIPAVKRALVELLQEAFADTDVQVSYGHPARDAEREWVFIGSTSDWDEEWAAIGAQRRSERFTLDLVANSETHGGTQQEATEHAFDLFAKAEEALNAQSLDGQLVQPTLVTFDDFDEYVTDEGRGTIIRAGVRCEARLSRAD